MRAAFASALDANGPVLVDLGGANHVDSYFLSELMMFARKCAALKRGLAVFAPQPYVARTFAIAGVGHRILVFSNRADALAALARSSNDKSHP